MMSNHVTYYPRTKFFQKLEDLIEIGKYNDFGSPYVVLLPQGTLNLCIQSSIFSTTNQHIKAKDFYTYYAYVSSKSISRIMAQLMTGVRNSILYKQGVLSMFHEFKFVISEIQFSKYVVDIFVDGYKSGYIVSYLLPTTFLNQLHYEEDTRKPAFCLGKIMSKSYSTKEQLTALGNDYYNLAKPVPRMREFRSE